MILNISNNTDIIRFYPNWLINRFNDGFFSIETEKQNNIYELNPQNFELLVFQTKDPTNIIPFLDFFEDKGYKFFFIITLTPYKDDIEPNLNKQQVYKSMKYLSDRYGSNTVIWKYAPIIVNNEFSMDYHKRKFKSMCKKMQGICQSCICEFVEPFLPPIHASLYAPEIKSETKRALIQNFISIGNAYNINLYSKHLKNNISKLLKQQVQSICNISATETLPVLDIGLKNTCRGNCEYCFSGGNNLVQKNQCFDDSPLAVGLVDKSKRPVKRKCAPIT